MTPEASQRVPLTPKEGWISNGRQVLRFHPKRWELNYQMLQIARSELVPGYQPYWTFLLKGG